MADAMSLPRKALHDHAQKPYGRGALKGGSQGALTPARLTEYLMHWRMGWRMGWRIDRRIDRRMDCASNTIGAGLTVTPKNFPNILRWGEMHTMGELVPDGWVFFPPLRLACRRRSPASRRSPGRLPLNVTSHQGPPGAHGKPGLRMQTGFR